MSVRLHDEIPRFNFDQVAATAGDHPDVLRMEKLDIDILPTPRANHAPGVEVHAVPRQ